jgi:hypothetical protein
MSTLAVAPVVWRGRALGDRYAIVSTRTQGVRESPRTPSTV